MPYPHIDAHQKIAILDIGSNSVRLVLYAASHGALCLIFNEKASCGLGRDLWLTQRLHPEGITQALRAITRFTGLIKAYQADEVRVVATAAVREATDSAAFIAQVAECCPYPVMVVSGEEEGLYAARGLLYAMPDAEGLVGDLGGASLELVSVANREAVSHGTWRCGALAGYGQSSDSRAKIVATAKAQLAILPTITPHTFYAVGGTWRACALIAQHLQGYSLAQPHLFVLEGAALRPVLNQMLEQGDDSRFARLPAVSKDRLPMVPMAVAVLLRLVEHYEITRVVFAGCGIREGLASAILPPVLAADVTAMPHALAEVRLFAAVAGIPVADTAALYQWLKPLLAHIDSAWHPLAEAACILSDIARFEQRDYRAIIAYTRILHAPLLSFTHAMRAWLATVLLVRSGGKPEMLPAVLDEQAFHAAVIVGQALRLVKAGTGGLNGYADSMPLSLVDQEWQITLRAPLMAGELVDRRLKALNKAMRKILQGVP